MKLLKKVAILSLCVLAVSGCAKNEVSTQATAANQESEAVNAGQESEAVGESQEDESAQGEMINPDKLAALEKEETVARVQLVEDETYEVTMFNWDQVTGECEDLFNDNNFYPESVKMDYAADEAALTIDLTWVLKNGTPEDVAATYATTMVQKFNDILAVQVTNVEFSSFNTFGGIWEQFALTVKVGTEDGTWLVDKSYAPGAEIDLKLPEMTGNGPMVNITETEERVSPSAKK